jgi:hypothetical protein
MYENVCLDSLLVYIYIKPSFDVESGQNCNTCPCFLIQIYENVCLDSLLVRQLKHRCFICNALNCLNEENKMFSNYLFLSLYLIFFSSSLALCLIVLMKKAKGSQIISLFIFHFMFSCFLFILSYIYKSRVLT